MKSERLKARSRVSWRSVLWVAVAGTLLLPLLAMQITDEVVWTGFDFIAAAALLISTGLALEALARLPFSPRFQVGVTLAIVAIVAILWAHGAVGVF